MHQKMPCEKGKLRHLDEAKLPGDPLGLLDLDEAPEELLQRGAKSFNTLQTASAAMRKPCRQAAAI